MELLLKREPTKTFNPPDSIDHTPEPQEQTFGQLFVNGEFLFHILEDAIREQKIAAKTCIWAGRYLVKLTLSKRFGRILPEILNVPDFTGCRFHAGNTAVDTEGCLLCGTQRHESFISQCAPAVDKLIAMMEDAEARGEEVWLTVENPAGAPERKIA